MYKKHIVKKSKIQLKGKFASFISMQCKGLKRWGNFFIKSKLNRMF